MTPNAHITDRIDAACHELTKIADMLAGYHELDDTCALLREVLAILEVRRASFDKFSIETTNQRLDPELTPKDENTVAHITDRIDAACHELTKIADMVAGYPELDDTCAPLREVLAILEVTPPWPVDLFPLPRGPRKGSHRLQEHRDLAPE